MDVENTAPLVGRKLKKKNIGKEIENGGIIVNWTV